MRENETWNSSNTRAKIGFFVSERLNLGTHGLRNNGITSTNQSLWTEESNGEGIAEKALRGKIGRLGREDGWMSRVRPKSLLPQGNGQA